MHRLLDRQLRKIGLTADRPPGSVDDWVAHLEQVSKAYERTERERLRLERSLNLATEETRDVYERMRASTDERYRNLFENANDIIYTVDLEGRFTTLNRAAELLVGYDRADLIGRHYGVIVAPEHVDLVAEMTRRKVSGTAPVHRYEIDIIDRDGVRRTVELSTRLIMRDGKPHEVLGLARDVSEQKEEARRLRHVAEHDPLTGLPNRLVLQRALREAIAIAESGRASALAFVDLDNFKVVNDSLGHAAGDSLLANVGVMLRGRTRPGDLLVRLGGDEFAILLRDIDREDAMAICDRLRSAIMEEPFVVGGKPFTLGVSIGLSSVGPGEAAETALALADSAMYTAKSQGGGQVVWGEPNSSLAPVGPQPETLPGTVSYLPVFRLGSNAISHFIAGADGSDPALETVQHRLMRDRATIDAVCDALREEPGAIVFVGISSTGQGDSRLAEATIEKLRWQQSITARLGFCFGREAVSPRTVVAREWVEPLLALGVRIAVSGLGPGIDALIDGRARHGDLIDLPVSTVQSTADNPRLRALLSSALGYAAGAAVELVTGPIDDSRTLTLVRHLGIPLAYGPLLGASTKIPRSRNGLAA